MLSLTAFLWALPWILLAVAAPFVFSSRPKLREFPLPPMDGLPLVSIIVPARNEAVNIGACSGSILHSRYSNLELIIVDDDSSDGTRHIAQNIAESDGRARVISGEPLPDGWLGKCWACWQGYRDARGELLLFTDADTRHDPQLLRHTVGAMRSTGADLVSLVPRQEMETFWERVVLPHVFTVLAIRYPDLRRVNRSRNPRNAVANGQFILMRRDAYEEIGGHEAVRHEVVEDLRIAQRTVAAGRRLVLANAEDLMRTRMYRSFGDIIEGWSKNLATGVRQAVAPLLRPFAPWVLGLFIIFFWVTPAAAFLAGLAGHAGSELSGWGVIATAAALLFWVGALQRLRAPLRYALAFPLGGAVTGFVILRSAVRGRRVSWKGRTYRGVHGSGGAAPGRHST